MDDLDYGAKNTIGPFARGLTVKQARSTDLDVHSTGTALLIWQGNNSIVVELASVPCLAAALMDGLVRTIGEAAAQELAARMIGDRRVPRCAARRTDDAE